MAKHSSTVNGVSITFKPINNVDVSKDGSVYVPAMDNYYQDMKINVSTEKKIYIDDKDFIESTNIAKIITLTQEEFNALTEYDRNAIYLIVTTSSETFVTTEGQTAFVLTGDVAYIKSIVVDDVEVVEYTYNISTKTITLPETPVTGANVVITYVVKNY